MAKFQIGDRVRFTKRCPIWIREILLPRARIIREVSYVPEDKATYYYLAIRGKGYYPYGFRSYMLTESISIGKGGRPPGKRLY